MPYHFINIIPSESMHELLSAHTDFQSVLESSKPSLYWNRNGFAFSTLKIQSHIFFCRFVHESDEFEIRSSATSSSSLTVLWCDFDSDRSWKISRRSIMWAIVRTWVLLHDVFKIRITFCNPGINVLGGGFVKFAAHQYVLDHQQNNMCSREMSNKFSGNRRRIRI